jgi:hypothetical protein
MEFYNPVDGLVEQYKDQLNTSTMYGIPLTELSTEQLQATCCWLNDQLNEMRKRHSGDLRFMVDMGRHRK